MTKLTLTYVASKPQVSAKTGKPYTSQSIKSTEYGDRFLSGFESKETMNWKVGDTVEVEVTESEKLDKNGKPYLNWKLHKADPVGDRMAKMEFSIANLHRKIDQIVAEVKRLDPASKLTSAGTEVPTFVPNTPEKAQEFGSKMEKFEKQWNEDHKSELESLDEMATSIYENM